MKVLLLYPPFCTPCSPPLSLANLKSFVSNNSDFETRCIDLNLLFHKLKFGNFFKNYDEKEQKEFLKQTKKIYAENNKHVVKGEQPELFDRIIEKIIAEKPDYAAFSFVYNSQCFYGLSLIQELEKKGIKTIIGGPAVNDKLKQMSSFCKHELEFLEFIENKKIDHEKLDYHTIQDYSDFYLSEYFTPQPVIPIKTSSSCYYKQCTFCTHHACMPYFEYDLGLIKETIVRSKAKYFFVIDDMIHQKRLKQIADLVKPLNIHYTCQLRPKDFSKELLIQLKASGMDIIVWGVESGNQRILDLMKKGTNVTEINHILKDSHEAGIKNVVYIMFGFPTETKEEFLDTINFLKSNKDYIDLVHTSTFGLQKNSPLYNNPKKFGINIIEEKRTVLEPKISYTCSSGLSQEEAKDMRKKYKKTIESINKMPKEMSFFREHMLVKY